VGLERRKAMLGFGPVENKRKIKHVVKRRGKK
jgi:hypothetical protein